MRRDAHCAEHSLRLRAFQIKYISFDISCFDLFLDITLVLEIDLTLGEALVIKYDPEKGFLLDGSLIDFSHIDRLKNH